MGTLMTKLTKIAWVTVAIVCWIIYGYKVLYPLSQGMVCPLWYFVPAVVVGSLLLFYTMFIIVELLHERRK